MSIIERIPKYWLIVLLQLIVFSKMIYSVSFIPADVLLFRRSWQVNSVLTGKLLKFIPEYIISYINVFR